MRRIAHTLTVILSLLLLPAYAQADECRGNRWQPTFVRHDSVAPTLYYVEPGGGFTPMRTPQEAQETCQARGVRNTIDGQNCWQRQWGDFGCGCNITPSPNSTCARFQDFLRSRSAAGAGMEQDVDRPGGDYRNFASPTPNPAVCQNACQSESQCRAWTYVKPGIQGAQAQCWLKSTVPPPRQSTCCISGVMSSSAGSAPPGVMQPNDRIFHNPSVNGIRVDWCLQWGKYCGKPAADEFCRRQGFTESRSFKVLNDSPPTLVIGSGQVCRESYCDGFSEVICAGGSSPSPGGSAPPQPRGGLPGGATCNSNTDCASGMCLLGVCSN